MFERLESAQPWAKGEATNNGSSMSSMFLPHPHAHRLPIHRMKQEASISHLGLIMAPLSRAACTGKRKIGRWRGSWLASALPGPSSKIQRWKVSDWRKLRVT